MQLIIYHFVSLRHLYRLTVSVNHNAKQASADADGRAGRCVTHIVLYTKVDVRCDKLETFVSPTKSLYRHSGGKRKPEDKLEGHSPMQTFSNRIFA